MSPHDRPDFTAAFTDMARALGGGEQLRKDAGIGIAHWEALQDLPIGAVLGGMRICTRSWTGMRTLPRPAELRGYCTQALRDAQVAQGVSRGPSCEDCGGDGWNTRWCHGRDGGATYANTHDDPEIPCQRPYRHDSHTYDVRCRCRQRQELAS